MLRRCLLVALLLGAAPSSLALAQYTPWYEGKMKLETGGYVSRYSWRPSSNPLLSGRPSTGAIATRAAAKGIIEAEWKAAASGTVRKVFTYGSRFVRTNALIIGASLIVSGLQWFYDEAQRATGTSLDCWYEWYHHGGPACEGGTGGGPAFIKGEFPALGETIFWYESGTSFFKVVGNQNNQYFYQYDTCSYHSSSGTGYESDVNDQWQNFIDVMTAIPCDGAGVPEPAAPPLATWMEEHPDSVSGVRTAMDDHATEFITDTSHPPEITGTGWEIEPTPIHPNWWWDDPRVLPGYDTDLDGYPDGYEDDAGTDPDTSLEQPDASLDRDGDGFTDQEELDASPATDPFDSGSNPGIEPEPNPDPQPQPEPDPKPDPDPGTLQCGDLACESTLADILGEELQQTATLRDALTEQREQTTLQREMKREMQRSATPQEEVLTDVEPTYDPWVPFENTSTAFEDAKTSLETSINDTWAVMQTKMPFGFVSWVPTPASVGSWECPVYDVAFVVDTTLSIAPCDNPLDDFLRNTVRPMLVALIYIGFMFAVVRTVAYT